VNREAGNRYGGKPIRRKTDTAENRYSGKPNSGKPIQRKTELRIIEQRKWGGGKMKGYGALAMVVGWMVVAAGAVAGQGNGEGADPERYELDRAHTYVGFVVRHLAVSNVRGRFTGFSGHVLLDAGDVTRSSVEVSIDASTIDTSNERRDNHLRSADFFEVERFPAITFASRSIEQTADGLVMTGDLTIRDVTREVRLPFEVSGPLEVGNGQRRLGAEATLRINRFDFGLQWNRLQEAIQVVGDEVRIELNIEAATPRQD
jgi:polyisoprenoid-binding protein YceI